MFIVSNICGADLNIEGSNLSPGKSMRVAQVTPSLRALVETQSISIITEPVAPKTPEPPKTDASRSAFKFRK